MIAIKTAGLAFVVGLVLAPAAQAGAGWDGFVVVGGSWNKFDFGIPTPGVTVTGHSEDVRLSLARMFPGNWGVQFDGLLNHQDITSSLSPDTIWETKGEAALHAFYRQPGHWLFGGIVQYGGDLADSAGIVFTHNFVGIEAEVFHGNMSIYGKAAFRQYYGVPGAGQGGAATLRARYYIKPTWLVEGFGAWGSIQDPSGSIAAWTWGGGTEFQLPSTPFSLAIKYEHERTVIEGSPNLDSDSVLGSFRWTFNDRTLFASDQDGASLDPFGLNRSLR